MIARRARSFVAGAFALAGLAVAAAAQTPPPVATSPFDFYVMTLSWSPGFCDLGGEEKSPEQCAAGSGDGFVVHGLWPDNRTSADPEDCNPNAGRLARRSRRGARPLSDRRSRALRIPQARNLHRPRAPPTISPLSATCATQLDIPAMFKAPQQVQRLAPEAIEQAFIDANANLHADNMAVTCARGELVDVRICLSKNLKAFSTCPKVSGHTCQRASVAVAPLR